MSEACGSSSKRMDRSEHCASNEWKRKHAAGERQVGGGGRAQSPTRPGPAAECSARLISKSPRLALRAASARQKQHQQRQLRGPPHSAEAAAPDSVCQQSEVPEKQPASARRRRQATSGGGRCAPRQAARGPAGCKPGCKPCALLLALLASHLLLTNRGYPHGGGNIILAHQSGSEGRSASKANESRAAIQRVTADKIESRVRHIQSAAARLCAGAQGPQRSGHSCADAPPQRGGRSRWRRSSQREQAVGAPHGQQEWAAHALIRERGWGRRQRRRPHQGWPAPRPEWSGGSCQTAGRPASAPAHGRGSWVFRACLRDRQAVGQQECTHGGQGSREQGKEGAAAPSRQQAPQ